jgi:Flp pilus assembly protein TadG
MSRFRLHVARGARRLLRVRTIRRLARQDDGVAAVEFGFVALPFFALLFAIIETSLVFLANQSLETAAADSARLVFTGQAQTISLSDFKTKTCLKLKAMFDCQAKLKIEVKTYATFADAIEHNKKPLINDTTKELNVTESYQPGAASQIVVVRLVYPFPVLASRLLSFTLNDMAGNSRLLVATVAFRNEPFGTTN